MPEYNNQTSRDIRGNYMVWFFAGAETRDNRFNIFTGSFIRLIKQILVEDFEVIKGIYFRST